MHEHLDTPTTEQRLAAIEGSLATVRSQLLSLHQSSERIRGDMPGCVVITLGVAFGILFSGVLGLLIFFVLSAMSLGAFAGLGAGSRSSSTPPAPAPSTSTATPPATKAPRPPKEKSIPTQILERERQSAPKSLDKPEEKR